MKTAKLPVDLTEALIQLQRDLWAQVETMKHDGFSPKQEDGLLPQPKGAVVGC